MQAKAATALQERIQTANKKESASQSSQSSDDSATHAAKIVATREIVLNNKKNRPTTKQAASPPPSISKECASPLSDDSASFQAKIVATREAVLAAKRGVDDKQSSSPPFHEKNGPKQVPSLPSPPPTRDMPKVGDNVLVRYRRNQWFLAHVVKKTNDNCFDVYFPEDFRVQKSVPTINIRPVNNSCTEPTRRQLIGKVFYYPGDDDIPASQWKVRRLISEENKYFCTCLDPKSTISGDEFEIGYVVNCYKQDVQRKYENPFL